MGHTYSNGTHVWEVQRLWTLAQDLPRFEIPLGDFPVWEPEQDGWNVQGLRDFVEHAQRVLRADLTYPVILSTDGWVMDGMHRIAKARLMGLKSLRAVRFESMPPPDREEATNPV
jgi:hypothetical protein